MSWWKYAKPGDKVVCVAEGKCVSYRNRIIKLFPFFIKRPVVGKIYTISSVMRSSLVSSGVIFCLEELPNTVACAAVMFKPVEKSHKGMEILKGIAKGTHRVKDDELEGV